MRVARGNVGILGEVGMQLCIFGMGEELVVMIDVCIWRSGRSDVSLGEEAGFCLGLDPRGYMFGGHWARAVAIPRRGRKLEINSMGEETE